MHLSNANNQKHPDMMTLFPNLGIYNLPVRRGLGVTNMHGILGEKGDTDHEELISGSRKSGIVKGIVERGTEDLALKEASKVASRL